MKNLIIALTVVLFASTVNASNSNIKFVSTDKSLPSELCIISAQDGYKAAVSHAKKLDVRAVNQVTCNGKSILRFSKSFEVKNISTNISNKEVLVIPANDTTESKVCAQAVKSGIKSVAKTANFDVRNMLCNGKSISRFVKQYSNT